MVWRAITYYGRSSLVLIQDAMTTQRFAGSPSQHGGFDIRLVIKWARVRIPNKGKEVGLSPEMDCSPEWTAVHRFCVLLASSDEAHFWLNGYVNKQNCRIWSEANPQVYVETPLHREKLTVRCALWAGGILLQKR
ncbi:hypothetical protein TNCV_1621571 [Trichonephila clavipes]|nr:hypothetical protein TNCV_1621571 [Trichonephila clavipes]